MNTYFAIGLFGTLVSVVAFAVLLWAVKRGQFSGSEEPKFAMLDESDVPPPISSPRRARLFLAVVATVFAFITASLFVTVLTATQAAAPVSSKSVSSPAPIVSPALKCPF